MRTLRSAAWYPEVGSAALFAALFVNVISHGVHEQEIERSTGSQNLPFLDPLMVLNQLES